MTQAKELMPDQKNKLKIDDEFRNLIPAITPEEKSELEKSILAEGCRESLVIWDGIILDGHNRFEICRQHKINFEIVSKEFKDRGQAKIWIISNQLSRRNLTPEQMSLLRGERYNLEKQSIGGQLPKGGGQNDPPVKTAEKLAKEYGVSPATIKRDAKFAEAVDKLPPEEKQYILSGKSKKTKKEIMNKGKIKCLGGDMLAKKIKEMPSGERESNQFKEAYEAFYEEVRRTKRSKWRETSKKVALKRCQNIIDLINV